MAVLVLEFDVPEFSRKGRNGREGPQRREGTSDAEGAPEVVHLIELAARTMLEPECRMNPALLYPADLECR